MERDMDLVRKILIEFEKDDKREAILERLKIEGYSEEQVGFHVYLMGKGSLLQIADASSRKALFQGIPLHITNEGYDFLDAARNQTFWNKAKEKLGSAFQNVSFEVLKGVLVMLAKNQLGM